MGFPPLRVGLVGTGFVAKLRAQTLISDPRVDLISVSGYNPEKTQLFCDEFQAEMEVSWRKLVEREDLDLVIISTLNRDHGLIARAALENDKHIVVEYPLCLEVSEGEEILALAQERQKLVHIEHIELLGGLHQAIKANLPKIGKPFYARYITLNPEHPVPPHRWTYQSSLFGFPLIGALSRIHRFVDLFGEVNRVNGVSQFWPPNQDHFHSCLCHSQLIFTEGLTAEVVYGKGENLWHHHHNFTIYGEEGALIFTPESGQVIQGENSQTVEVGSRRGLFAKDTQMVIDHLIEGSPLYVSNWDSLYSLKVAASIQRSCELGVSISLSQSY